MEQSEETWQRGRRKAKHHLETSPQETFRVVEEEEEAEVLQDTAEDPSNPRIGEGERISTMKNIRPGMPHKQLERRLKKMSLGGIKIIVIIVSPRRILRIEIPLGTSPKTMRLGSMKRGRELEAQVPEVKDTTEGTEA